LNDALVYLLQGLVNQGLQIHSIETCYGFAGNLYEVDPIVWTKNRTSLDGVAG
jgi:hypothetical protein